MMDTRARSLAKAVSYRVISSLVTGMLLFGVTQKGWLSVGIALVDSLVKTSIFYLHERTWMTIWFARKSPGYSAEGKRQPARLTAVRSFNESQEAL
jgi:uncharacterized membrane protein